MLVFIQYIDENGAVIHHEDVIVQTLQEISTCVNNTIHKLEPSASVVRVKIDVAM